MHIDQISVQEFVERIQDQQDIFILDVRTHEEYQTQNIGGHHIPLPELAERVAEVPRDKLVVIHCRSGVRSQTALHLLKKMGYIKVRNLVGGMESWNQYIKGKQA